jgi:hypothetical protein
MSEGEFSYSYSTVYSNMGNTSSQKKQEGAVKKIKMSEVESSVNRASKVCELSA